MEADDFGLQLLHHGAKGGIEYFPPDDVTVEHDADGRIVGAIAQRDGEAVEYGGVGTMSKSKLNGVDPQQIIGGTGVGDAGANAYARSMGITAEAFLAGFGAPMPPREFGEKVVSVLEDPKYADGFAFGLKGDSGISILEGAAA